MARILNASFYNGSSSGEAAAAAARVLPSSVDVLPLSFWGTLLNVTVTSAAVPGDGRWGRKEVEARRREAYRFKDMMIKACVRCVEGTWTSPTAPNACEHHYHSTRHIEWGAWGEWEWGSEWGSE